MGNMAGMISIVGHNGRAIDRLKHLVKYGGRICLDCEEEALVPRQESTLDNR